MDRKNLKRYLKDFLGIFLIFIFSFIGYKTVVRKKEKDIKKNKILMSKLKKERKKFFSENKELTLQINSHKDHSWIEMVLIRELGVVPDGKLKVRFINKK